MAKNLQHSAFDQIDLLELTKHLEEQAHGYGRIDLVIEILRKIRFDQIIKDWCRENGKHEPDIPYEVIGLLMMANLMNGQEPLYNIFNAFTGKDDYDFKGTFGIDIPLEKLNDDRFGSFLDLIQEMNPREFFTQVMVRSMTTYGIKLTDINYDTTSKIMWGEYETPSGSQVSTIDIAFGHSKQKRSDKKQMKMALGVSGGVVVDALVLSGNMDDKTYNKENIARFNALKQTEEILPTDSEKEIFYIADSAAATEETFKALEVVGGKIITRMPDNYKITKEMVEKHLANWNDGKHLVVQTAKNEPSEYRIFSDFGNYKGHELNIVVCYSYSLQKTKVQKIEKAIQKEKENLEKIIDSKAKQMIFSCEADACSYKDSFISKGIKMPTYHDIDFKIEPLTKRAPGKAPADPSKQRYTTKYELKISFKEKSNILDLQHQKVIKECTFMLASNDMKLSAEEILNQYKTQSSVEIKFQQLKSSKHFVNALFVKKTERVEALMYLFLIALQVSSIIEHVVRNGLEKDQDFIRGRGNTKQFKPSFRTILELFEKGIGRTIFRLNGQEVRKLSGNVREDHLKILRYLGIELEKFSGVYASNFE